MAKAFEEFDDFFKQSAKAAKTFVRGSTINPNASGTYTVCVVCGWVGVSGCVFECGCASDDSSLG